MVYKLFVLKTSALQTKRNCEIVSRPADKQTELINSAYETENTCNAEREWEKMNAERRIKQTEVTRNVANRMKIFNANKFQLPIITHDAKLTPF